MIEKILIISLFTIGYCCTFWEGMIFERIGNWMEGNFPEWFNKPTWSCYICSCFWFGTALYWLAMPHCTKYIEWNGDWFEWGLCVIPAMGLNAVISQFTNKTQEVEVTSMPEEKLNTGKQYSMEDWELPNNNYMGKVNEELKKELDFIKRRSPDEVTGNIIISTTYKGIYRQYQYYQPETGSHDDIIREEEFAKNVLTHAIERALKELPI